MNGFRLKAFCGRRHVSRALLGAGFGLVGILASPLHAVIFLSTADPNFNTTAPTGDLAGSGWDLQGEWGPFLGTPIAPHYFITAKHVGGAIGESFVLNGMAHTAIAFFDDPGSDLRIWQIADTFSAYAPLYGNSDEVGQPLVVYGRGTQRGDPVSVTVKAGDQLDGWRWGPADGKKRWGQNVVASIETGEAAVDSALPASMGLGDLLKASFDRDAGPNEADLSVGDSGGAVFIQEAGVWKLAGLNYGVDGPYSLGASGPGFQAALFNQSGLFTSNENGAWTLSPPQSSAQPGAFYATRISAHLDWIESILNRPAVEAPVLLWANLAAGPYQEATDAAYDSIAGKITVPVPPQSRFYRLRSTSALTIHSIAPASGYLILNYN